ncbi:hypothetical protein HDU81_004868 [Chytriomyces hyalinus]|nr:hypothetical protein HDU81_004868 [Chytriomyces hyalinus]
MSSQPADSTLVRARGTLEDALDNGGSIVHVQKHQNTNEYVTVFVRVPRDYYGTRGKAPKTGQINMVFTNVSREHLKKFQGEQEEEEEDEEYDGSGEIDNSADFRRTRQSGTLEEAIKHGAKVLEVHSHEHNNDFSVTVRFPDDAVEGANDMIFTNVSMQRLEDLSKKDESAAAAIKDLHLYHPSKLTDLMAEPGSRIYAWHPTNRGTYSTHIACADGCTRTYTSVSEEHMKQWVPDFEPGSSASAA